MSESFRYPEGGMPLPEARRAIDAMRGSRFANRATGIVAQLSSSAKGKLVSNKATGKSKANGFTREQHNVLAANVGALFEAARLVESRPDRMGDANVVSIKRFAQEVFFGARKAVAWMTIKESRQHGHHIYSVEAIKVEALDRIVEVVSGNTPHASSASTESRIASSGRLVKGGLWIWLLGSIGLAAGIGRIVCNLHESIESVKYRGLFYGLVHVLCGAVLIWIACRLDNKRREDEK